MVDIDVGLGSDQEGQTAKSACVDWSGLLEDIKVCHENQTFRNELHIHLLGHPHPQLKLDDFESRDKCACVSPHILNRYIVTSILHTNSVGGKQDCIRAG